MQVQAKQDIEIKDLIKTSAPKHAVSISQFEDKVLLDKIFAEAARLKTLQPKDYPKPLQDKIVATLFFEPSTRTRLSFETAVQRLGGQIISVENAGESSSKVKGESLEDTIRTINGYADAIVIRHPEVGSAQTAASVANIPIINGGDGAGDHPTQALLDLFTILEAKGSVDGLKIGLIGDNLNARTTHALAHILRLYKPEIYAIAPKAQQLPKEHLDEFKKQGITVHESEDWDDVLSELDVIYLPRFQKERFADQATYEKCKDTFIIDNACLQKIKKDAIIMSPLPRTNELAPEIDSDPRAIYFEQARNGLFVRMALLEYIFE